MGIQALYLQPRQLICSSVRLIYWGKHNPPNCVTPSHSPCKVEVPFAPWVHRGMCRRQVLLPILSTKPCPWLTWRSNFREAGICSFQERLFSVNQSCPHSHQDPDSHSVWDSKCPRHLGKKQRFLAPAIFICLFSQWPVSFLLFLVSSPGHTFTKPPPISTCPFLSSAFRYCAFTYTGLEFSNF